MFTATGYMINYFTWVNEDLISILLFTMLTTIVINEAESFIVQVPGVYQPCINKNENSGLIFDWKTEPMTN